MFLIGCAGQAQMGKDLSSDWLQEKLNHELKINEVAWKRAAFAANVKKIYADTFGVDRSFIEQWKTNPESPPGFDQNVRKSLQFIGDGFRQIKGSIWVDLMFRNDDSPRIISDVRYINELASIYERGGFNLLIVRPEKLNNDPNSSEAQIKPLIEWAIKYMNFTDGKPELNDDTAMGMGYVNYVVFNLTDKEALYNKLRVAIDSIFEHFGVVNAVH